MARFQKYGLYWQTTTDPASIELDMVKVGGEFTKKNGDVAGLGLTYHFKEFIKIVWPHIKFHRWLDLFIENYVSHRTLVVLGPASSGKTLSAALCVLVDYFAFPDCTTILCCSTTRERLEDRIFGELKSLFQKSREVCPWLPGNMIESRQRIITDSKFDSVDGRDFRNGIIGVPCKRGQDYVGLGDFIGIKNKRVRLLGDELHLLPRVFVDSISNLDKNPDFKCLALGNPKDTLDALGVMAEPSTKLGGWESGIDQQPGTKTWETRRIDGICLQLPGTDSPNLDGSLGIPLITQKDIDRDVSFYGKESLWYTMFNLGQMPRGQGSRRVLTRQMCFKFRAMEEPIWKDTRRTRIAFLDAAYRGVGGDRCVFGELDFGYEAYASPIEEILSPIATQYDQPDNSRQIIALIDTVVVPISPNIKEMPEDQIVAFVQNQCNARGIPPENFFYDSGMRTSLVSAFSRIWSPQTCPVDCGGTASEDRVSGDIKVLAKDYYSKKITELWFSVRLTVEASQFRGMTEDVITEFSSREWTMVGANKIEVEPKIKMREKMGRSPDLADAVAIGLHGARQRGFVIKRLLPPDDDFVGGPDWRDKYRDQAKTLAKSGQLNYAA